MRSLFKAEGARRRTLRTIVVGCAALGCFVVGSSLASAEEGNRQAVSELSPRPSGIDGVGFIVDVPETRHPVTRATIDEHGRVRLDRGPQRPAPRGQGDGNRRRGAE